MANKLIKIVATGGGLGYAPKAPGTIGTLGALAISCIIMALTNDPFTNYIHIILAFMSYLIGVYVTKRLIPEWGDDPGKIVIDEYCGLWVALIFTPPFLLFYILAFILFRFFDITKILGISYFDRMKTAHGVMLDDVLAGLYTAIVINLLWRYGGVLMAFA